MLDWQAGREAQALYSLLAVSKSSANLSSDPVT